MDHAIRDIVLAFSGFDFSDQSAKQQILHRLERLRLYLIQQQLAINPDFLDENDRKTHRKTLALIAKLYSLFHD